MFLLFLFFLISFVIFGIAYSRSAAHRARRKADDSLGILTALDRELQRQDEYARSNLASVAGNYIQEVRIERL